MKLPLRLVGCAVRDAEDRVIISGLNPCTIEEREQIVAAVNATIGARACQSRPADGNRKDGEAVEGRRFIDSETQTKALNAIELRLRVLRKDGMIEPTVKWINETRKIALRALGRQESEVK